MDKYNWEGINYPSEKDDWKKFEKYDLTIALNVLYDKNKKIYPALVSKSWKRNHFLNDSKRRWMILWCRKKEKLSVLLRGITSKNHCDSYYFDCFHSLITENKDFCDIMTPPEDIRY